MGTIPMQITVTKSNDKTSIRIPKLLIDCAGFQSEDFVEGFTASLPNGKFAIVLIAEQKHWRDE